MLRLTTGRADLVLVLAACTLVPLFAAAAITTSPTLGIGLVAGIAVVALAARSLVYPVVLSGVPALLIGFRGSNPLPGKVIFASLTAWLLLGLGLSLMAGRWPAARRVVLAPLLLTMALGALLMLRLDSGTYPLTKVELFVAQDVLLLVAGILIAAHLTTFRLYVLVALGMSLANAGLLTDKIFAGNATKAFTGRFTISVDYDPITAGRMAASGVVICVALVLASRSKWSRLIGFAALPVLSVALLASGSRGPVVALFIALVILVALNLRDRQTRSRLLLVSASSALAFALVAAIVPAAAIHRSVSFFVGDASGLSSNGRTHLWSRALGIFAAHPLTGVGTGGFANYEPIYKYPHNIVLEAAAELGVVGAVIVTLLLVWALRTAFQSWSISRTADERMSAALVAALLVAAIVNALLSDAIETSDTLFLTIGLAYGLRAFLAVRPQPTPRTSTAPGVGS